MKLALLLAILACALILADRHPGTRHLAAKIGILAASCRYPHNPDRRKLREAEWGVLGDDGHPLQLLANSLRILFVYALPWYAANRVASLVRHRSRERGNQHYPRLWGERVVSLPPYRSGTGGEPDLLGRSAEAEALAELITARSSRSPLTIGVFGAWGMGKSHFLGQLRDQVRERSGQVAPDGELTHWAVRQVWFNPWHYAETDPWVGLVSELYSQLAPSPGPGVRPGDEKRWQSRLAAVLAQLEELRAHARQPGDARERPWDTLGRLRTNLHDDLTWAHPGSGRGGESAKDETGDELPAIDRIVVYIDDLDRCPPAQVIDMLEALHLLPAAELFVVVVAVDPRWLLQVLNSHFRDQLGGVASGATVEDEGLWRASAVQYLEKIFQVVLSLTSLATTDYASLIDGLINPHDGTARSDAGGAYGIAEPSGRAGPAGEPSFAATAADPVGRQEEPAPDAGNADLPAPRIIERADPLAFSDEEQRLLHLVVPPLITTPRAVKRLAYSYGLFSALHAQDLAVRDGDEPGYRAAMALLAALVGYPELGSVLFPHIRRQADADPHATWTRLIEGLHPRPDSGTWRNEACTGLDDAQCQQWESLASALDRITERSGQEGMPLPRKLATWAGWIEAVGRLSFSTG